MEWRPVLFHVDGGNVPFLWYHLFEALEHASRKQKCDGFRTAHLRRRPQQPFADIGERVFVKMTVECELLVEHLLRLVSQFYH